MASLESTLVNSIVGAGTFFKGTISVTGLLRIDGDFSGGIKSSGRVIIGRGGRADCTIDAATVVIGGVFRGTVYAADRVIALETAVIIGNIYTPRLIAETGVILDGAMHVRGANSPGDDETGTAREAGAGDAILPATHRSSRSSSARRRRRAGSPSGSSTR
jgi:cytoskeletal protein CcmA (bactofilin family)